MNKKYFYFNGNKYYVGTIIKVRENAQKYVRFASMLNFIGYDENEDLYYFESLYNSWERYGIKETDLVKYIECIAKPYIDTNNFMQKQIEPAYVEGIVSAWIWYILIMFFALFLKGIDNVIIVMATASFIFWNWRKRKINGE